MEAKTSLRVGVAILSVGAILLSSLMIAPQPGHAAVSAVKLIDNFNRQAVIDAYLTQLKPGLKVPTGWTGNTLNCIAGATSKENKAASLTALNYVRAMADLPPVKLNSTLTKQAQAGALISEANRRLTHTPSSRSLCYSRDGYRGTSRGNISLGFTNNLGELSGATGARVVAGYMTDDGELNKPVGHRRWILYPRLTEVGLGDTDYANNMVVMGGKTTVPKSQWVTWPTAGYFPRELEPQGRWSISYANADFKNASVSVKTPDGLVSPIKRTIRNGYADNTLAWDMQLPKGYNATNADYEVSVTVTKILVGKKYVTRTYKVNFVQADPKENSDGTDPYSSSGDFGDSPDDTNQPDWITPEMTAGYVRPQMSFLGATSCTATSEGWLLTATWKVTGGNYKGLWYGERSGLKSAGDTWEISSQYLIITSVAPTGENMFRTWGMVLEFLSMTDVGRVEIIDVIRFSDWNTADITGLCR
jgi:uncharacterized protein YkwD